jgi:hypothetical protein
VGSPQAATREQIAATDRLETPVLPSFPDAISGADRAW